MAYSFNYQIYGEQVKGFIPDIGEDDLKWLCNRAGTLYKELVDAGCVDNFRASRVIDGRWSEAYEDCFAKGCCGFRDDRYTNPLTGNEFFLGFNFGH